jgi:RNA polymerase sigma-70 factor (ECF subfamily)
MESNSEQLDQPVDSPQLGALRDSRPSNVFGELPFIERLEAARRGSLSAVGSVFEECRNYLLLIANRELGPSIQAKIGASDLVQETFLQARQALGRFQGSTRQELLAWLAQILEYKLSENQRFYLWAERRDSRREQPLDLINDEISQDLRRPSPTFPDEIAASREEWEVFHHVLELLPEKYSLVIKLRSLERRGFVEVGRALNRSPAAARAIWARAMLRFHRELKQTRRTDSDG